jgi:hypothetical protein
VLAQRPHSSVLTSLARRFPLLCSLTFSSAPAHRYSHTLAYSILRLAPAIFILVTSLTVFLTLPASSYQVRGLL